MILGNLIKNQFLTARNWPFGAAISVFLLLITYGLKEFMNKYNEIKKINDDYQSFIKDRKYGSHYMADQHDEVENEWVEEWTEKLYGMELNEESILRELADTLAFDISRHQFCDEICLVEECIRETNN